MKKITTVEQRALKSKTGKEREGIFKFTKEITNFSTGKEEDPKAIKSMFNEIFKKAANELTLPPLSLPGALHKFHLGSTFQSQ